MSINELKNNSNNKILGGLLMKFCSKCGAEMFDDAVICVKCGCPVESVAAPAGAVSSGTGVSTAAKVFMIIGTVLMALYTFCIGLAWCLPLTISYCNKLKRGERIGTGFKVCSLLFVSLIGGILMLCDKDH